MPNALTEAQNVSSDKNNAISRTQAFWEKKSGLVLSEEEARRLNESVTDYFRILKRWALRTGLQLGSSENQKNTDNSIWDYFITFAVFWIMFLFFKCSPDER